VKQISGKPPATHPVTIDDDAALTEAIIGLRALDPDVMIPLAEGHSVLPLNRRAPDFEGLAWVVISQQLSTRSAEAIFDRTRALFDPYDAKALAAATDEDLRLCGLSGAKIRTLRAISAALAAGLDFGALAGLEAEEARAHLVSIKGIGPWTADIFLLFCLGHADIWPGGDLALQEAVKLVLALETRPTVQEMTAIAERWRPYRAVAARLLWAHYRHVKEQAPRKLSAKS
jgi:DNA-3-methyladenine glycosylase II